MFIEFICIAYRLELSRLGSIFVLFVIWMSTQELFTHCRFWCKKEVFMVHLELKREYGVVRDGEAEENELQ